MNDLEKKCTCDAETIEPHECPYASEIKNCFDTCKCCKYCESLCQDDI